jgi:uncharacterized membrane protein HdeD (DUF308 family)
MNSQTHETEDYRTESEELRKHWGLAVGLGLVLLVLGAIAVSISAVVSLASMIFLGWLLIVSGIVQGIEAFTHRRSHFFSGVLLATLYVVVGVVTIANPVAAELAFTLMMIVFFLVAGIFRIVSAAAMPLENRWSLLASGIVALILGLLLWTGWPMVAFWIIGLYVGMEIMFNGWSVMMLGIAGRRFSRGAIPHAL